MFTILKIFDDKNYTYYLHNGRQRYKVLDYQYSPQNFTTSIILDGVEDVLVVSGKVFEN